MDPMTSGLRRGAYDQGGFQFASQLLLWAAVKIDLFSALAGGDRSAYHVAAATRSSLRGVRVLLDCLAAMGLLHKKNDRYDLSVVARRHLLPEGEDYCGAVFARSDLLMKLWLTLPEAVETGRPTLHMLGAEERETLNLGVVDALFQAYRGCAWRLAGRWAPVLKPKKMLDVAAGSAVWSIPFALSRRRSEVTAVDVAAVLPLTRRYARRFGVDRRYRFIAGDIARLDFGRREYDLALLGHICHSVGASGTRALFGKCFEALREGGRLFVIDYVPDEERKREVLPLVLAVNALLGSDTGDTFTFSEYKAWLLGAGFGAVRAVGLRPHSPVLIARKG